VAVTDPKAEAMMSKSKFARGRRGAAIAPRNWTVEVRVVGEWRTSDLCFAERWEAERLRAVYMGKQYPEIEALRVTQTQRPVNARWGAGHSVTVLRPSRLTPRSR